MEKKTTFDKDLFNKAQSEGKIIVISSWIEYCGSCANQMKVLQKAKKEGELLDIKFDNIEYFAFDVTNRDIADSFDVLYQTTLLIFKGDTEVYRAGKVYSKCFSELQVRNYLSELSGRKHFVLGGI